MSRWPLTLAYHGVVPAQPGRDCVDLGVLYQDEFERQLGALRRRYEVLHGDELADLLERGKAVPRRSALVTLDDGYQNLLDCALPVAEALRVPILAFVATGHMDGGEWLWFSRLHAARLRGGRGWQALLGGHGALRLAEVQAWLDRIDAPRRAGADALGRALFDGARSEALARAARGRTLALGGHTVGHPRLPNEERETVAREVLDNKQTLERLAGRPVRFFAYPEGVVTPTVAAAVRDAGYLCAFVVAPPRAVPADLARFYLPRVGIYRPGALRFRLKCLGIDRLRGRLGRHA